MSPNGTLNLVVPEGASSVSQIFAGQALDSSGNGVPSVPLYIFMNGAVIAQDQIVTDAGGNYNVTVTFTPSTFPQVDTIDIADNQSNT
jgi:hypothetical protein